MDFFTQIFLKIAVGSYLLIVSGSLLYALNKRVEPGSVRYGLIVFCASLWVLLNAINESLVYAGRPVAWLPPVGGFVSLVGCFFIFDFALLYPQPTSGIRRLRIIGLAVMTGGMIFLLHPDWLMERFINEEGQLISRFGWPYAVTSTGCAILAAAAFPILIHRLRGLRDRRHRRQIINFLGGLAVTYLISAIFLYLLPVWGITKYFYVGVLSVWFFAFYSLMSVYRYGVIDFRRELRETIHFLLLFAGILAPVTIFIWWLFGLVSGGASPAALVFGLIANLVVLQLGAFFWRRTGWKFSAALEELPEILALKRRLSENRLSLSGFRRQARRALDLDYFTIIINSNGERRTLPRGEARRLPLDFDWPQSRVLLSTPDLLPPLTFLRDEGYDVVLPLPELNALVLAGTVAGGRTMNLREISYLQYFLEILTVRRRVKILERQWRLRQRDAKRRQQVYRREDSPPDPDDPVALVEYLFRSAAMRPVMAAARKYAPMRESVLISGATGAGKGVLAGYLHALSENANREMITLDCGTIPADLVESELFGHEQGAFTGAAREHRGVFERAQDTNLFLDEIGELTPDLQHKLLRVLQERVFYRVGGDRPLETNARFFFATNRDLPARVRLGEFRADLFYRIHVMHLALPSLSERREEIPVLSEYYLSEFCEREKLGRLDFSLPAMDRLLAHSWPGNLRELKHAVHRASVHAAGNGRLIGPEHIELDEIATTLPADSTDLTELVPALESKILSMGYKNFLGELEREIFERFFQKFDYRQSAMARRLGLERNFLRRKLNDLGVLKKPAGRSGRNE